MDKCSCETCEYFNDFGYWTISYANYKGKLVYCPFCGDQLLPDGRVIQRETVPNKLMDMLREVQENCPKAGLQEFALRVLNWIEEMREQAGLTEAELAKSIGMNGYSYTFMNHADDIDIDTIFTLLNAAKQEAKK